MAMTPTQVVAAARSAQPGAPVVRRLASDGAKPNSYYLAAARKRGDRDYTPRFDIIDA
jgi:hypothetical protein